MTASSKIYRYSLITLSHVAFIFKHCQYSMVKGIPLFFFIYCFQANPKIIYIFRGSSVFVFLLQAAHRAVLHIGEKGTEAVALPEVRCLDQAEITLLHPIIQLDRSFLLLILEKNTRSILFLGKVVDPTKV